MVKKSECECNHGHGLIGLILLTVGIYFVVMGFFTQASSQIFWNWNALLYYLVGLLLMGIGKVFRHKGYGCCDMHSM